MRPTPPSSAFDPHEAPTMRNTDEPPSRGVVLVVDDEPEIRDVYCAALGSLGYRTIPCADGCHALDAIRTSAPDVVLIDMAMPVMSGLEAARSIKEQRPGVLVIAMTAFSDQKYFDAALAAGCDAFLCKPFNPFVLETILDALHVRGPIVKRCSCGRQFTRDGWAWLPVVGVMEGIELRNCPCGSSIALTEAT